MIHRNIIIQKLDILGEFNAINDGQLYILRGHRLYFRKKCILSLTIDFVLANSVDSDQMRIWVCTVCQNTDLEANSRKRDINICEIFGCFINTSFAQTN